MKLRLMLPALCAALGGCAVADTVANIGRPPRFSKPTEVPAPAVEGSLASSGRSDRMPPPRAPAAPAEDLAPPAQSASLFRPGAAGLFRDNRAYARGDILTIKVQVADKAALDNATTRSRTGSETAGIAGLLGLDRLIDKIIPGKTNSASVSGDSKSGNQGSGTIARSETINLSLAAVVTDVTPNGNLVIRGRQEMRVDNELRELVSHRAHPPAGHRPRQQHPPHPDRRGAGALWRAWATDQRAAGAVGPATLRRAIPLLGGPLRRRGEATRRSRRPARPRATRARPRAGPANAGGLR